MEYEVTPNGPMARGSSAAMLRELLDEYEDKLERLGGPVRETMLPGLDRVEIEAKLASRGLAMPEEIAVWYGWHNGYKRGPVMTQGIPIIFPTTLDQSLKAYDDSEGLYAWADENGVDYESVAFGAVRGWLPLQGISEAIAVQCVIPGDEPPRVIRANASFTEPGLEHRNRAVSLCTVISRWIESAEIGAFRWDPDRRYWHVDYDLLLTDLTGSLLG